MTGYTIIQQAVQEIHETGEAVCPHCMGDGSIETLRYTLDLDAIAPYELGPCPICNGRGFIDEGDLHKLEVAV